MTRDLFAPREGGLGDTLGIAGQFIQAPGGEPDPVREAWKWAAQLRYAIFPLYPALLVQSEEGHAE